MAMGRATDVRLLAFSYQEHRAGHRRRAAARRGRAGPALGARAHHRRAAVLAPHHARARAHRRHLFRRRNSPPSRCSRCSSAPASRSRTRRQEISAVLAAPDVAAALGVDVGSALVALTRVVCDAKGRGVEHLAAPLQAGPLRLPHGSRADRTRRTAAAGRPSRRRSARKPAPRSEPHRRRKTVINHGAAGKVPQRRGEQAMSILTDGTFNRRQALLAGAALAGTLALPGILRAQAAARQDRHPAAGHRRAGVRRPAGPARRRTRHQGDQRRRRHQVARRRQARDGVRRRPLDAGGRHGRGRAHERRGRRRPSSAASPARSASPPPRPPRATTCPTSSMSASTTRSSAAA